MNITETVSLKVTITLEDLKLMAWVIIKTGDPTLKIRNTKKLKEICSGLTLVNELGYKIKPEGECLCNANYRTERARTLHGYGDTSCTNRAEPTYEGVGTLEARDAINFWMRDGVFIG